MTNGLWKGSLLVLVISLYWKKITREHTKNPNAYVQARPVVTFWAVGYHPSPRVPTIFSYILCKI